MRTPWVEQIQADLAGGSVPVIHLHLNDWRGLASDPAFILTPEEQQRAGRFQYEKDRMAFVAGRWLVRSALDYWSGEGEPLAFDLNPSGKPVSPLPDVPGFNLTHANGIVALALSSSGPVGVDLEDETRSVRSIQSLARRYFAQEEQERVHADAQEFFRIWTRREARVKAEGIGISRGFSGLNTFEEERRGNWCYTEWRIPGSHRGTVVHAPPSRTTPLYVLFPEDERLQSL